LQAWGRAEEDFSAVIEAPSAAAKDRGTAYLARARCRERLGKLAEAVADCGKAFESKHEPEKALALRSYLRRALGDHAGSIRDGERRLALKPDSPDALNDLSWFLATAPPPVRDLARAESLSRSALEREPGSGGTWNTLGLVLYRRGDLPGALAALEKALPRPDGGTAFDYYLLSLIHGRQGQLDLARQYRAMAAAWEEKAADLHLDQLQDLAALRKEVEEAQEASSR